MAKSGDVLLLLGGTYGDDLVPIRSSISIKPASAEAVIFSRSTELHDRIFDVAECELTMSDITFNDTPGSALTCSGGISTTVTLTNITFSNSVVTKTFGLRTKILTGGAITADCNLIVKNSSFRNLTLMADSRTTAHSAFGGAVAIIPNCTSGNLQLSFDGCTFDGAQLPLTYRRGGGCA